MESIAVKFGGGGIFPSHQSAGSALVRIHFEGHIQEIAQVSTGEHFVPRGRVWGNRALEPQCIVHWSRLTMSAISCKFVI